MSLSSRHDDDNNEKEQRSVDVALVRVFVFVFVPVCVCEYCVDLVMICCDVDLYCDLHCVRCVWIDEKVFLLLFESLRVLPSIRLMDGWRLIERKDSRSIHNPST